MLPLLTGESLFCFFKQNLLQDDCMPSHIYITYCGIINDYLHLLNFEPLLGCNRSLFFYLIPFERHVALHLNNSLLSHLKQFCIQLCRNWPSGSKEIKIDTSRWRDSVKIIKKTQVELIVQLIAQGVLVLLIYKIQVHLLYRFIINCTKRTFWS